MIYRVEILYTTFPGWAQKWIYMRFPDIYDIHMKQCRIGGFSLLKLKERPLSLKGEDYIDRSQNAKIVLTSQVSDQIHNSIPEPLLFIENFLKKFRAVKWDSPTSPEKRRGLCQSSKTRRE
jgi:hypothetical protein